MTDVLRHPFKKDRLLKTIQQRKIIVIGAQPGKEVQTIDQIQREDLKELYGMTDEIL